jgi:chaperonin GroES
MPACQTVLAFFVFPVITGDWHTLCPKRSRQDFFAKKFNLKSITQMADINLQPLADRVLVEPMEAETKTASGISIPDTAQEKPQQGVVVAAGKGKKDEPMTVKKGDKVLYGKYGGTEIKHEGKDYLIMRESDIFAIIG